jgi:hypothetical protein
MIKKVFLDYDFSKFLEADYKMTHSCILHQKTEMSELHSKYGGFPKQFVDENTEIRQLWWSSDQVDYIDIGNQLGMEVKSFSSILQPPGQGIPNHMDFFYKLKKDSPEDSRMMVRAVIFVENWHPGEFIQYCQPVSSSDPSGDVWHNLTHWRQGEGILWNSGVEHISVNFGFSNKFTLQVSGFLN